MDTRLLKTDSRKEYDEAVKEAARVLASGGLVGLPTETVYGIAASAEHAGAIDRLREIKRRPAGKKFTICIPLKSDAARFAAELPRPAEKLAAAFWPGPLTLVVPGKEGAAVGLRMPGLTLTRDVLLESGTTVVIPSANPHGEPPATTAREVMDYFDGGLELIIDGGPAREGVGSTVVEEGADGERKVLREGALSEDEIRRALAHTILFVCTGNLCRSPMAEGFARARLGGRLGVEPDELEEGGYRVLSAGTAAMAGSPPSPEAIDSMKERGIDISPHRSRPLTPDLAAQADEIFVMAEHHLRALRNIESGAAERARLLSPQGRAIADPIGQSMGVYRRVRDELSRAVRERLEDL